ncbi:MAG: hypothetical protein H0Z35_05090 [Thermoanaerobacteraceae bacterium]|nr:hypothetical protein [Thermoanaerobacteraceae bacterium]
MGEQTILATFPSSSKALAAQKELKEHGFNITQVDHVGKFSSESNTDYNNPLSGRSSLSGLTEYSGANLSRDVGPLLAVDNAASGYAADTELANLSILLTAVVPEEKTDEAMEIIKNHGGTT